MPPAHIFIVRHGERTDHVDADSGMTDPRPHDVGLTERGVGMAASLGAYLVRHYKVDPVDVVIFSSPLTRCVQTAHGIAQGALGTSSAAKVAAATSGTKAVTATSIPIFMEPAMLEGPYWMFENLRRNPDVVDPVTGTFTCPEPLLYDGAHHRQHTSPYVRVTNPFPLHPPPTFRVEGHTLVDASFPERCVVGAKNVLVIPELAGKTVVLVGHNETVPKAMHALTDTCCPDWHDGLTYTAFVHLTCEQRAGASGAAAPRAVLEFDTFSCPHLACLHPRQAQPPSAQV